MKFKKIILFFSGAVGITLSTVPLTSCFGSIFSNKNNGFTYMNANIENYRKDSEQLKYISERSLSLKFEFSPIDSNSTKTDVYGTGWIVGKDKSSEHKYYVATNMHVAGALSLSNYSYKDYRVYNNSWYYNQIQKQTLTGLDIGIVGKGEKTSNNFSKLTSFGTTKPQETLINNNTYDGILAYIKDPNSNDSVLKSNNVSIVYSGYQSFNNQLYKDVNNINLRYNESLNPNNYLYNPTSDIAILSIDFSPFYDVGQNGNAIFINNVNVFKSFLDNYDKNPTKFASQYKPGEDVFVAGFPAATNVVNNVSPRWSGVSYVKTENLLKNGYEDSFVTQPNINGNNVPLPDFSAANEDEIKYYGNMNNKDFFSFRNSATQVVAWGVDLKGGSSGSVAINSKNEVIGIYWGGLTYKTNGDNKEYFSGRIDLLNGNGPGSSNRYKYNILNDITKILNV
ncbi:DUF31 family putative serine protease [Malacoplasma iowae]|uniref:Peptidase, S7 superfamily n=1 Tax=Malacoplasma iowae DK-CPA TaxID=1394179 RepID=A0A084U4H3_MALIO|nr:hypothetical protein [Malacoplasma iowae]KFB07859.1 peptidase, S7 superfamily [Malacoplasma iowae DK-CPA]WPL37018.1 hypothetical protein QX179_00860 [Malacoplasma iowae]WPL40571.1 hypothetical protein QX184_03460 [Malacoplasma iowae]